MTGINSMLSYGQIFDAVTLALHRAFPEARIHGGEVPQDLLPGDLAVIPVGTAHRQAMGTRAARSVTFDVIYFPPEGDGQRADQLRVAEALPILLGTVTTPEGFAVHALSCDASIDEDVSHVTVSYPHFVYMPAGDDRMREINSINIGGQDD